MIRLREIANPVISPESIIVSDVISEITPSVLQEFKEYLGFRHTAEDANLSRLLLAVLREYARPTSVGLAMNIATWTMRVELAECRVVYLPRYNGMNLSVVNFNENGLAVEADWSLVGAHLSPGNIELVTTDADPLPFLSQFEYTVGFNEDDYPDPVKQSAFMYAGFNREFPLGVGDAGQEIPEVPRAVELVLDSWRMKSVL